MEKLTRTEKAVAVISGRMLKENHGFTLIEVMVVVAIVGIISAVAILNMISWRGERQLEGAARNFYTDMQLARLQAIRESLDVSVVMNSAGGNYQMFVDVNRNYNLEVANGDREIRNITMPPGIAIAPTFGGPGPGDRTRFDSRGRPSVTGTLTFQNSAGTTRRVVINTLGRLRIVYP